MDTHPPLTTTPSPLRQKLAAVAEGCARPVRHGLDWLDARLPAQCLVCHSWPSQMVCPDCMARWAAPVPRCHGCARRLPHPLPDAAPAWCADCLRTAAASDAPTAPPAPLHACYAAVSYQWPWRDVVDAMKFRQQAGWARALAALWPAHVLVALHDADWLIPLPLHPTRLAERGYNQALALAQALRQRAATHTGLPAHRARLLPQSLMRTRATPPQSGLDRAQRLKNLRHAFAVPPRHATALHGRSAILVDDVMTTGTTLHAAAQTLQRAGCTRVMAVVLARTEKG